MNFWNFSGGVQRFWRLFCKRKATGEANAYKQQNGKSSMQTTQNRFCASKPSACADLIQLCRLFINWPSTHAIALLQHNVPASGMLWEINFGRLRDNFSRKILQENIRDNHCYTQVLKMTWTTHMDPQKKTYVGKWRIWYFSCSCIILFWIFKTP